MSAGQDGEIVVLIGPVYARRTPIYASICMCAPRWDLRSSQSNVSNPEAERLKGFGTSLPVKMRVIDSHLHVGSWGKQTVHSKEIEPFNNQELDSFQRIRAFLHRHKIARAVVVPMYSPEPTFAFRTNIELVKLAQQGEGSIIPGFWVDPSPEVRHLLNESLELAAKWKISVLKTSPDAWAENYSPDPSTWDHNLEKGIERILQYSSNSNAILQIHTGHGKSDIRAVEKLMHFAGPGITFHLVHMGNDVSGHFYMIPRLVEWISRNLDIVWDTSRAWGFAVRWILRKASAEPRIANRILFASDEPWGVFDAELSKVLHASESNQEIMQKVLWKNAERLYGQRGLRCEKGVR